MNIKTFFPSALALLALAFGVANYYSLHKSAGPLEPREISNIEWLQSLPHEPGVARFVPLSESLELLDFTGFRVFARLPKIEVKPGMALYYLYGQKVYEGPPGKLRLIRRGLGMEYVVQSGGSVSLADLPEGFECTVIFRRAEGNTISGFERFGFVDPTRHSRVSGGSPFTMRELPVMGIESDPYLPLMPIELDKEVEFAGRRFVPNGPNGQQDDEHAITVRWYYIFKVAPRAF